MKAWMRWARGLAATALRRPRKADASPARSRYRVGASLALEGLEGRTVLSATGLASFATLPAHITSPTSPARVTFNFNAGEITAPAGKPLYLGFNAQAAAGSLAAPQITKVFGPAGGARHRAPETGNSVFITKVNIPVGKPTAFAVDILSMNNRTGDATVSAFLPGDVNGDGAVDSRDISMIRSAYGSHLGQARYNPAADFNGDGKVGCRDLTYAKKNLGAFITLTAPTPAVAQTVISTPAPAPLVAQPAPQPVQVTFAPAPTPVAAPVQTVAVAPVQTVAVAQVQAVPVAQVQYAPATTQATTLAPFNGQVLYTPVQTQAVSGNVIYAQNATSTPVYTQGTTSAPVYYQLVPVSSPTQVAASPTQYYTLAPAQATTSAAPQVVTYAVAK